MHINSINHVKNIYSKLPANKIASSKQNKTENHSNKNNVSFHSGPNAAVLENKAKIIASIDIMSRNPKIKLPENEIEKKAVLEVLEQRSKLNKYIRLRDEAREIRSILGTVNELLDNSKLTEATALLENLEKRGNIDSILKTLDKQIEQEEKRNLTAFKYFENIDKTMQEYLDKKLINENQLDKAWYQIKKNNINTNDKLSPKELMEIINSEKKTEVNPEIKILSRRELLNVLEKEYESLIRQGVNIYATQKENQEINNQYDKSRNIRYLLNEKYGKLIKRYPGMDDALKTIYSKVEKKYSFKVNQLVGVDIYPIGEIWDQMKDVEKSIKDIIKELPVLKESLKKEPNNKTLEMEIIGKEIVLAGLQKDWIKGMKLSINYESLNRQRMFDAGHIAEYDYLTSENKTLNRHKQALKIYNENNDTIPDFYWNELIK